jgi:hypothetical protein
MAFKTQHLVLATQEEVLRMVLGCIPTRGECFIIAVDNAIMQSFPPGGDLKSLTYSLAKCSYSCRWALVGGVSCRCRKLYDFL